MRAHFLLRFSFWFCSQAADGYIFAETCSWFCIMNKLLCLDWIYSNSRYTATQRRWITSRLYISRCTWQQSSVQTQVNTPSRFCVCFIILPSQETVAILPQMWR